MRRVIVLSLVCLMLGVVTTITVAWSAPEIAGTAAGATRNERIGAKYSGHWLVRARGFEIVHFTAGVADESDDAFTDARESWWVRNRRLVPVEETGTVGGRSRRVRGYEGRAAGWPFIAMYQWNEGPIRGPNRAHLAAPFLPVRRWDPFMQTLPRAVWWPGFVGDTVIFGTTWATLFLGLRFGVRARRRQRGLCPKCAYDLRGDLAAGCSECGWNR